MSGDQPLTIIAGFISSLGVVASMTFIGWQIRQSTYQRRISNAIAGTSGLRATLEHLHSVQRTFIDKPHLRPYFSDGVECPGDDNTRHQVKVLAEMFGDVLEVGLVTNENIHSTESKKDWMNYCTYILQESPTIRSMAREQPTWWPRLLDHLKNTPGRGNSTQEESVP